MCALSSLLSRLRYLMSFDDFCTMKPQSCADSPLAGTRRIVPRLLEIWLGMPGPVSDTEKSTASLVTFSKQRLFPWIRVLQRIERICEHVDISMGSAVLPVVSGIGSELCYPALLCEKSQDSKIKVR